MLDGWTVAHFWGWAWIGALAFLRWRLSLPQVLLLGLVTGLSWELAEYWLVEALLRFSEPPSNRLVDVFVDAAGAVAGWWMQRRAMLGLSPARINWGKP